MLAAWGWEVKVVQVTRVKGECHAVVVADKEPESMQFGVGDSFVAITEKVQSRTQRDASRLSVKSAAPIDSTDVHMGTAHPVKSKVDAVRSELEALIDQRFQRHEAIAKTQEDRLSAAGVHAS